MKNLAFIAFAFVFWVQANAQSFYPEVPFPQFFKTIPQVDENTPDWAVMMYGEDPNMYEVTDAYIKYYQENEYTKTVHGQNYKFWIKTAGEYVNNEGFIRLPSKEEEDALYKKLERRHSETALRNMGSWSSIGPFETYHGGSLDPTSNLVNVYKIDQSNSHPNVLYAGTEGGAIFKTTDRGLNWSPTSYDQPFAGGYGAVEIHPTNPDLVLAAVNNRIYRTSDGGATWTEAAYLNASTYELKFRPSNPDSIFCAASNGLFLSTDAGVTWGSAIFSDAIYDIDWHTSDENVVFLLKANTGAVRAELFRSDNGGATWTIKDNNYYTPSDPANAGISGGKIALTAANPNRVYVALIGADKANDNGWIGVLRSDDLGENWTIPAGQYGGPYQSINTMPWNVAAYSSGYHQGFYNFDCEASPNDADLLWIGTVRLTESADGGASFTAIGAANSQRLNNVHADIQDIEVNGDEVWVANDGGIEYSSDQLQSSTSRKKGIAGSDFWGFGTGWNKDVFTGGLYHNGNATYYQEYGVGNSIKLGGVEEATGYIHPLNNQLAFHGYGSTTDARSVPDALGDNYQSYADLPKRPNEHYWTSYSSGLYFDPRYADHFYMGEGSKIWKSTDGGLSFQSLNDFGSGGRTLEIAISRKNPDYIYVVFVPDDGGYWDWRKIYRTTDGGDTWSELATVPASSRAKLEIALNPEDENEIWVAAYHGGNGSKVYQSTDGGFTWVNKTTSTLDGESIRDIFYQGGTSSLVYALSDNTIFYFDQSTSDWVDYGNGLPLRPRSFRIEPFYREKKIRMATFGQGIWENSLASASQPIAQPMTNVDSIYCSRDTVQFDCYSILNHSGASWQWTFNPAPQWVSSLTDRNPQVVFGANGNYDVTLAVTDGGGNMDSKTITDMVKVNSRCEADTIPGLALRTAANGDYFVASEANFENVTHFTVTGWWKPNGAQQAYSALFSSGDWCAHCDYTEGLIFDYGGSRLWYKWPGNVGWAGNSGIEIPLDEWSYVAMVVEPDKVTLYLNDEKYVSNTTQNPGEFSSLYIGYGHYSKSFKGDIDEVTMWTKALSESEIRRLRHLTKEDEIGSDPDLIGYWQFNELVGGSQIMDMAGPRHGSLVNAASLATSTAPIGGGISQTMDLAAAQTTYDFTDVGAKIYMSDCEGPNGQLVVSRLNIAPDVQPNANDFPENYWIFNLYDGGGSFPPLDSVELTSNDVGFTDMLSSASDGILHLRNENGAGATWETKAKGTNLSSGTLRFNRKSSILGDAQITLSNGAPAFDEVDPGRICEADSIPGYALDLPGNSGDYAVIPAMDLNTNTFTASAWVKSDGIQNDWAAIIFCRDGFTTAGLSTASNNELRYHWNGNEWSWSSGVYLPQDEWAHVALVIEPTQMHIYLNGVPTTRIRTHSAEEFNGTTRIGNDANSGSRTFDGLIDEVCIWDRALSQNEIRELMHLTKEDIISTDPNLKAYFQFNEPSGKTYDKSGNGFHTSMNSGNLNRVASTAPVGGGTSARVNVNSGGVYSFGNTGMSLGFNPSAPTFPDGELCVSRLNVAPETLPSSGNIVSDQVYWIIRNFGANSSFTALDSLVLDDVEGIYSVHETSPELFSVFKRNSNSSGATWGSSLDNADWVVAHSGGKGKITFSDGNGITDFSQFAIGDARGVKLNVKVFLEGPYSSGFLNDDLRSGNLLPTSEPYTGLGFNHVNGGGNESCLASVFATEGNDAIVDWVMVELRDKNDPTQILYTRSALLQRDGDVVDTDGTSALDFRLAASDDYFVAVRHRNHLSIMTNMAVNLSGTSVNLNFTDGSVATHGTNAQKEIEMGVFALWAADLDASGSIDAADRSEAWNKRNQTSYQSSDATMNGSTDAADRSVTWNNRNLTEQLP